MTDAVEPAPERGSSLPLLAQAVGAALALLLIAAAAVRIVAPGDNAEAVVSPTSLSIAAPFEIPAGERIDVTVTAPVADRTDVTLGVFSALESTLLEAVATNGTARFDLEAQLLDHAGRVTLVAQIGDTRATRELIVRPGLAVAPVVPLVGPRTIVADGQDRTMVVISPVDAFGNPVAARTQVSTRVVRPDGSAQIYSSDVQRGLASSIVTASTTAGRVSITSTVGEIAGPAHVVDQVAGRPAAFTVETIGTNDVREQLFADGFTLFEVSSSELRDTYDNLLPDGVVVLFTIESPDGLSFAEATVQNGYATTNLQSPSTPGSVAVRARTSGEESEPLRLTFRPAVRSLAVSSDVTVDGWPLVRVGPVVTERGGYPADGTAVTILDDPSGAVLATSALSDGFVEIPLRSSPPERVLVEVLGTRVDVELQGGK